VSLAVGDNVEVVGNQVGGNAVDATSVRSVPEMHVHIHMAL